MNSEDVCQCRYCFEMIKWGVAAKSGKAVPLDAKPVRVWIPTTEPGRADPNELRLEVRTGWISHFATCTGADQARADAKAKQDTAAVQRGRS